MEYWVAIYDKVVIVSFHISVQITYIHFSLHVYDSRGTVRSTKAANITEYWQYFLFVLEHEQAVLSC
jgi:hypothetical protein